MKSIVSTTLLCSVMAFAAASASAQDAMKKADPMAKEAMGMKKEMSMQDCKDHMAMKPAAGMKKDDAMMKKDETCAAMMKKDAAMMHKDGAMMKKDDAMMNKDGMKK